MHIRAQLCVGRVVRSWRTCHPWPLCVDYIWYGFPKRDKGESQGGLGKGTTAMFFSYCSASQSSWGASWLAGWLGGLRPGNLSCAWLAGWGAGWLAEAQRGPERPREAQRGGAWIERACHALGIHTHMHSYMHTSCLWARSVRYIHTYIGLSAVWPVHFIESFLWAPPAATQFSVVRAPPVATLVSSFHFVSSFLWAPPVATQFSVCHRLL